MRKLFIALAAVFFLLPEVFAQTATKTVLEQRPAQVSILPGVGTNGANAYRLYQPFSFNLLGGSNGGASGFELGGLLNINRFFVRGLQIGGLVNKVGASDLSVAPEISEADSALLTHAVAGAQIAGLVNNVKGGVMGLQLGGIANRATTIDGAQIGGVSNVAQGEMNGFQIGTINRSGYSRGLQLGVINIADSSSGATVGVINIIKHGGYYRTDVWAGETFYANAAFKTGSKNLYTILTLGWGTRHGDHYTGYGIGLGIPLKAGMYLEQLVYQINENDLWTTGSTNLLQQLRLTRETRAGGATFIYGGTLNFFTSNQKAATTGEDVGMKLAPYSLYQDASQKSSITIWPGANLGIRF